MAKIYDNKIDKHTDWGGDRSTGGLAVSGGRVQEFIKGALDSKMGALYYDETNSRYLVFADNEARDSYLSSPETNAGLLLGTFDAVSNYSASITLLSDSYNAVLTGAVNNVISFDFAIVNRDGLAQTEDILCTYTFRRGSTEKSVNKSYRHGTTVNFNIDQYLLDGVNTINIQITGKNTLASTSVGVTYQVVNLKLTDNLDISIAHDVTTESGKIVAVPYHIEGSGTKTMEWYIDGSRVPFDSNEDVINSNADDRVKYLDFTNYNHGRHTLQIRASVLIAEETFYSKLLYRDIIVIDGRSTSL